MRLLDLAGFVRSEEFGDGFCCYADKGALSTVGSVNSLCECTVKLDYGVRMAENLAFLALVPA